MIQNRYRLYALYTAAILSAACGDSAASSRMLAPGTGARSGGTGGGGTTVSGVSILPTTPPAPDVLMRESFGMAAGYRPQGGKGTAKAVFSSTALTGFWIEYPGSKNTQWIATDVGQSWNFAGCSDNPWEMPSPLQAPYGGCTISAWFDPPTSYPTALMPITVALPAAGYELSMEGYPAPIPGGYIAIGFTNSGATTSNFTTSGSLWLRVVDTTRFGVPLHYELRTGSLANGQILASGDGGASGYNRMSLRYSPATSSVTLTFDGVVIGTYGVAMSAPKFIGFEGVGVIDDVVLRQ